MTRSKTADLGAQIGEQRDRLTETVGALTDKVDVSALTDKIDVSGLADKIDTDALRERAGTGAEALLDNVTDADGKPRRGVLVGLVVGVLALFIVRRVLK